METGCIQLRHRNGTIWDIDFSNRAHDPLHFVLLFPHGDDGWHPYLQYGAPATNTAADDGDEGVDMPDAPPSRNAPGASPSPSPALIDSLLERLRVEPTHSCVLVPFAHALLQTGEAPYEAEAAAWATHDPNWTALGR